jgi:hypothetical protein
LISPGPAALYGVDSEGEEWWLQGKIILEATNDGIIDDALYAAAMAALQWFGEGPGDLNVLEREALRFLGEEVA